MNGIVHFLLRRKPRALARGTSLINRFFKEYMRISKFCLGLFWALICGCALLFYYLFFTAKGNSSLAKLVISKYISSDNIKVKEKKGGLSNILSYDDISIENIEFLPKGSLVKIQRLDISFVSDGAFGFNGRIYNGRLMMPGFDAIFLSGTFQKGELDINIYSKNVNIAQLIGVFTPKLGFENASGSIKDIDAYIKGTIAEPEIQGTFHIDRLARYRFGLADCRGEFNLKIKDIKQNLNLSGWIDLSGGKVSGLKNTLINLATGKLEFSGDLKSPVYDLKGNTLVEGTNINLELKGKIGSAPNLLLSSPSSLSQEGLLVTLVTGKSWSGVDTTTAKGQLPADLVKDFVDYFFFSGSGARMAQYFGINDVLLTVDDEKKGVEVKTSVTERLGADYKVEQAKSSGNEATMIQKVGGEYKITDTLSIGAEKELLFKDTGAGQLGEQPKPDDRIILKYKKKF